MSVKGLKRGVYLNNNTYRIEGVLGQGSFGITYLATGKFVSEGKLGSMVVEAKVAIKEFFMGEVNSRKEGSSKVDGSSGNVFSNYRKKFRKEAENLAKLSHPNIVKVIDVFDENNTTYYVMEFIEGQNLDEYIRDKGTIPEDEVKSMLKEIGEALEYMHSQKMLHLDLKPKNIMRRNDGTTCLIDFGLSKQFTEGGEPESSTSIGLGTPGYAPIEQASYRKTGKFPATLDVYALGATLFKMLTGTRPPEATTILNEGFPDEEISGFKISSQTVSALKNAMAPIWKQRTPTIKALVESICNDDADDDTEYYTDFNTTSDPTESNHFNDNPQTNDSSKSESDNNYAGTQESNKTEPIQNQGNSQENSDDSSYTFPIDTKKTKSSKSALITVLITVITALFVVFLFWLIKLPKQSSGNEELINDSIALSEDIPNVEQKVVQTVTGMAWDSPLGPAGYTGEVIPDTIEGSKKVIPHGNGLVEILEGEYAGNKYEGELLFGKMEGRTLYTQKNGDTFVGQFKDNKYYRGRYKIKSPGEYFEGTFRNGQPDKGNWYDKNGNKM